MAPLQPGILPEAEVCPPPSRLLTPTTDGQRVFSLPPPPPPQTMMAPPPQALSLLSARVSVKWKRVSGTMAARQKPPARMLNGGARGACHQVNNGAWTGGVGAVPQQQHRLGGPEVRSELEGSII